MNDRGITATDTFDGGPGDDIYNGTPGDDTVHGNGGNDTLNGAGGNDSLYGDDGNDHIDGGDGNDYIYGGQGADTLIGGAGDDTFFIGSMTDVAAGETIDGGSGSNKLLIMSPNYVYELLDISGATITNVQSIVNFLGSSSPTVAMTIAQMQSFSSFSGFFKLTNAGSVSMSGISIGSGITSFKMSDAGNVFDLTGAIGTSVGLIGQSGNDTITGNGGDDTIWGQDGNDILNGAGGNDTLNGGAGVDTIHAGAGDDIIYIDAGTDIAPGEVYDGGTDTDTLSISASTYGPNADLTSVTLTGIERIDGGYYNYVTITATTAQLAGVTFLHMGMTVLANGGAISFTGATVDSPITLADAGNSIDLSGAISNGNIVYGRNGDDTITGTGNADGLYGNGGNDVINGGGGNDAIVGGAGADQLNGGPGDDRFRVANSADVVAGEQYDGGSGTDTLYIDVTDTVTDISSATLTSIEVITTQYPGVALTTSQLQGLTGAYGSFQLTNGGAVSMNGINLGGGVGSMFTLSAAGNIFDLTGAIGGVFVLAGSAMTQSPGLIRMIS
jgi:Ca2+-binding RTX toxin-like protein